MSEQDKAENVVPMKKAEKQDEKTFTGQQVIDEFLQPLATAIETGVPLTQPQWRQITAMIQQLAAKAK